MEENIARPVLAAVLGAFALAPGAAFAGAGEGASLRHLSADTLISVKRAVFVPANSYEQRITSPAVASRMTCFIRFYRSQPYDRVLRQGSLLRVSGADENSLSARGAVYRSIHVYVRSESVSDILCEGSRNAVEPDIAEFKAAVRPWLELQSTHAPVEID